MGPNSILVVDDDPLIRDLLEQHLTQEGHAVQTAVDGVDGLEKFEQGTFDAVIVDLEMPRMDGVELIGRLKEASPQTITIVLTGVASLDSAIEVLRHGCDDYLLKPLANVALISHSIERCLSRRHALLMAASAWKIGEAKSNTLSLAVTEFERLLGRLKDCISRLESAYGTSGDEGPARAVDSLKELEEELVEVVSGTRSVSDVLRTGSPPAAAD